MHLNLTLSVETDLSVALRLPEPVLPGDQKLWCDLFDTFLVKCRHHHSVLLPDQSQSLFDLFIRDPGTLQPDQMALVLSMLALGQHSETQLRGPENLDHGKEVAFFRLALGALEQSEQASQTSVSKCRRSRR